MVIGQHKPETKRKTAVIGMDAISTSHCSQFTNAQMDEALTLAKATVLIRTTKATTKAIST